MSEPRTPSTNKPPAAPSSSRTVVIAVVALLIVVAIAGIVLAGRKGGEAPSAAVAASGASSSVAVAAAPAASATPEAASAPTAPSAPDEILFLSGSDRLPPDAAEKIAAFAQQARSGGKTVRISVRFLTGANKTTAGALAKARADAIHHAMMADGVTGAKMQVEMVEMPEGSLTGRDADRAVLSLR